MFKKLTENGKIKNINSKVLFEKLGIISADISKRCFSFAYNMTFGNIGEHRNHRTGGEHQRKKGEIFANTYNGKLAEFAVYEQLKGKCNISEPDLSEWGKGKWDDTDFVINSKEISIKSMKHFSNLLLLEKNDWNRNGGYIPNNGKEYDLHIMVRVFNDPENVMKQNRLLYSNNEISENDLWEKFKNIHFEYDIPGYIKKNELIDIISSGQIIYRGDILNGTTEMDADNFYCQTGDVHRTISELLDDLK